MAKKGKTIEIIKANGQRENFSGNKLLRSLRRAGATNKMAQKVLGEVLESLEDGMQTRDIYKLAFRILRNKDSSSNNVAYRYNLRNAIMELGPDGFAFEKFVGEIMKSLGHKVKVGIMIEGWCIEHEVDVSAKKDGTHVLIECKFHNTTGYKTDLKVALYVRERFQDIEKKLEHAHPERSRYHEGWLMTNTKLTTKAIQYSQCVGQKVIGWGYPKRGHGNLEDLIEQSGIHPITGLSTLSKQQKKHLLRNGIITCRQIYQDPKVLKEVGVVEGRIPSVLNEMKGLHRDIS